MRKTLCILAIIISFNCYAKLDKQVGCFSSENNINIKYIVIYDNGTRLGYVKYAASDKTIPLVFSKDETELNPEGRPEENTIFWYEFINREYNGQYTVMSQGARYYSLVFTNKKGEKTIFDENLNAYSTDRSDCIWSKK